MNSRLDQLQPYPFEKLTRLKVGTTPDSRQRPLLLSVGEPRHPAPPFVESAIAAATATISTYPSTQGSRELREAIASWLTARFHLPAGSVDADAHILPVNGTREALFAIAQCVVDPADHSLVVMPNPFYQIYEGATLLAGARPYFINLTEQSRFLPDFSQVPAEIWQRCCLVYINSPGNPTGAVLGLPQMQALIALAEEHDFLIASDECYSEIYPEGQPPPPGLLEAAAAMGNTSYRRCLVFHSLSKRSSVPGLRSGFVAGDAAVMKQFLLFRTYHGSAMPPHTQAASVALWSDEEHVKQNRHAYTAKFQAVTAILSPVLPVAVPAGSFYLWLETPVDDTQFALGLFRDYNVTVLPGSYLSRQAGGVDPGSRHIRVALVGPLDDCVEAAERMRSFVEHLRGAV